MAELIRNGEYAKIRKASTEDQPNTSLMRKRQETTKEEEPTALEETAEMIALIRASADEFKSLAKEDPMRPRTFADGGEKLPIDKQGIHLREDPEFMNRVAYLQEKHGVTETELFNIIKGESAFDPMAVNPNTNASGLFQFIPDTAKMLGTDVETIQAMSPAEQLDLYDKYLDTYDYQGEGLGIMQAAPAYRKYADDEVIYDVGSAAWKANPGWRPVGDGPITKKSLNRYYNRERG